MEQDLTGFGNLSGLGGIFDLENLCSLCPLRGEMWENV
jgi:hypothetical protein